jgi:hypothetical protein
VFFLVNTMVFGVAHFMPGEIGHWLSLARGAGVGLPCLLVGLDMIIAPEKVPFQDVRARPPEEIRGLGCSILVFGALMSFMSCGLIFRVWSLLLGIVQNLGLWTTGW